MSGMRLYTVIQKCQAFYVMTLREELGIPTEAKVRQYTEVSEQPPDFRLQVDMGQKVMTDPFGATKIKSTYSPWS